jgi:hypothetical protein
MKMKTGIDLELRTLLREELHMLLDYLETFDYMTQVEKDELREWMAHGNSVNSNPFSFSGDNGCPIDFIRARRLDEDIAAWFGRDYAECNQISDLPF